MVRDLRCLKAHLSVYYYDPNDHLPADYNNPPQSPKFPTGHFQKSIEDFVKDHIPAHCTSFTAVTCESNMTDYNALKVPELKKLLGERKLPATGNKADLVKRLQDADAESENSAPAAAPAATNNAEDEIDYEDDDVPAAAAAAPAAESAPEAAPADAATAPTTTDAAPAEQSATTTSHAPVESEPVADTTTSEPAVPPAPVFTANLPETDPDSEAAKRLARAKRFGISEDDLAAKKAERAARFGLEKDDIAKTIDAPLPERQRKRGRGAEDSADKDGSAAPAAKKVANGGNNNGAREGGGRQRNGRGRGGSARPGGHQQGGGGRKENQRPAAKQQEKKAAAIDPAEKAKLEARAKRFAS